MMLPTVLIIYIWILQLNLPLADGKCCRGVDINDCGDDTWSTPCCGYKKCNGFCCACPGTTIVSSVVSLCGVDQWTAITAPPGTTWTCRAKHTPSTWATCNNDRRDFRPTTIGNVGNNDSSATITGMPRPTSHPSFTPPFYSPQALADLKETFDHVCGGRTHNGIEVVSLDDYFGFFNVTGDQKGSNYANNVTAKFRAHDINGDGMLTFDEVQLLCDETGCD